MLAKLPASGSTTFRAIATDQYGTDGQVTQLVVTVQMPQPPTLHFTLVSPTNGVVPDGTSVIVDVTATADTGISNFSAVAGGAATGPLLSTNGTHLRVTGFVPTNAVAGQPVQIFAQVTDDLGLSSGQQVFSLPTRDTLAPTLAILAPTNNAVFEWRPIVESLRARVGQQQQPHRRLGDPRQTSRSRKPWRWRSRRTRP